MHIIYATDGSEGALAGAQFLARLPLEADCRLTLLTVLPEGGDQDAEAILASAREALRYTTASIDTDIHRGHPAEEILRAAEPHASLPGADLIVVGSSGRSAIARFLLGSVAERVARHAGCPVLVARPVLHELRRALVAVDGSEVATRAAQWLRDFPMPAECEFQLMTVLRPMETVFLSGDVPWPSLVEEFDTLYRVQQDRAREQLDALVADFDAAGRRAEAGLEVGDPAHILLQAAEERHADLIIIGSRGLSGIERFVLGSVSEKVLRHAHCSVLVVKEESG